MERGMTVDQVMKALWRRRLLVLAVAGATMALGAAVVVTLPSVYQATAVVRVEPHHPIADMVQPTISETVDRRIVTIRQELLSRTVLQRTIEELDLYPEVRKKRGMDGAVDRIRKDLEVRVEGENAFELTYSGDDPEDVAQVANRLPQIFAEQAVRSRQAQAERTTRLFEEEMKSLKLQVSDHERRIAQFKVDHMGELPEQLEVNMRGLERVAAAIQLRTDELRMAEVRRADMLRAHHAGDSDVGRLKAQELEAQRALIASRAQWTAEHPEVQKLGKELEVVRTRVRHAEDQLVEERRERARMSRILPQLQGQIDALHQQAEAYQVRLDNTPRWTHELGMMTRDYEMVRAKYDSVVSRKVEAELAQELELRGSRDLFQVISPASVPSQPASPDRVGGLVLTLLIALALGVLAGVLTELRDDSIRDVDQVKQRLPMPVLAVVPEMGGAKGERRVLVPQFPNRHAAPENLN